MRSQRGGAKTGGGARKEKESQCPLDGIGGAGLHVCGGAMSIARSVVEAVRRDGEHRGNNKDASSSASGREAKSPKPVPPPQNTPRVPPGEGGGRIEGDTFVLLQPGGSAPSRISQLPMSPSSRGLPAGSRQQKLSSRGLPSPGRRSDSPTARGRLGGRLHINIGSSTEPSASPSLTPTLHLGLGRPRHRQRQSGTPPMSPSSRGLPASARQQRLSSRGIPSPKARGESPSAGGRLGGRLHMNIAAPVKVGALLSPDSPLLTPSRGSTAGKLRKVRQFHLRAALCGPKPEVTCIEFRSRPLGFRIEAEFEIVPPGQLFPTVVAVADLSLRKRLGLDLSPEAGMPRDVEYRVIAVDGALVNEAFPWPDLRKALFDRNSALPLRIHFERAPVDPPPKRAGGVFPFPATVNLVGSQRGSPLLSPRSCLSPNSPAAKCALGRQEREGRGPGQRASQALPPRSSTLEGHLAGRKKLRVRHLRDGDILVVQEYNQVALGQYFARTFLSGSSRVGQSDSVHAMLVTTAAAEGRTGATVGHVTRNGSQMNYLADPAPSSSPKHARVYRLDDRFSYNQYVAYLCAMVGQKIVTTMSKRILFDSMNSVQCVFREQQVGVFLPGFSEPDMREESRRAKRAKDGRLSAKHLSSPISIRDGKTIKMAQAEFIYPSLVLEDIGVGSSDSDLNSSDSESSSGGSRSGAEEGEEKKEIPGARSSEGAPPPANGPGSNKDIVCDSQAQAVLAFVLNSEKKTPDSASPVSSAPKGSSLKVQVTVPAGTPVSPVTPKTKVRTARVRLEGDGNDEEGGCGFGLDVGPLDGLVSAVHERSPAAKAGVRVGWRVQEIYVVTAGASSGKMNSPQPSEWAEVDEIPGRDSMLDDEVEMSIRKYFHRGDATAMSIDLSPISRIKTTNGLNLEVEFVCDVMDPPPTPSKRSTRSGSRANSRRGTPSRRPSVISLLLNATGLSRPGSNAGSGVSSRSGSRGPSRRSSRRPSVVIPLVNGSGVSGPGSTAMTGSRLSTRRNSRRPSIASLQPRGDRHDIGGVASASPLTDAVGAKSAGQPTAMRVASAEFRMGSPEAEGMRKHVEEAYRKMVETLREKPFQKMICTDFVLFCYQRAVQEFIKRYKSCLDTGAEGTSGLEQLLHGLVQAVNVNGRAATPMFLDGFFMQHPQWHLVGTIEYVME